MRIAIASDFYLPSLGGTQTSIVNQKRALEAAGHTVYLFVPQYGTAESTDDARTTRIPCLYLGMLDLPLVAPTKKLTDQLTDSFKKHRIDAVHVQTEFGLSRTAVKAAKALGIPTLLTVHTFSWKTDYIVPPVLGLIVRAMYRVAFGERLQLIPMQPGDNAMTRALKSCTVRMATQCDAIVSPSAHVANSLQHVGVTTPITIMPNPVFVKDSGAAVPLPKVPRFVWPSRCRSEKRILEFIAAVRIAKKQTTKQFFVDIVGDGPLLPQAKLAARGDKSIVFHGRVSADESIDIISKGSVVALSSHDYDNQPMIVGEAILHDRGVLYCDERLREGLGNAGYLTAPQPKAIAVGIVDLVEHPQKIAKLSSMATHDKYLFSPEHYAKQIEAVLGGLA